MVGSTFPVGDLHSFTSCRFVPAHPNGRGEPPPLRTATHTGKSCPWGGRLPGRAGGSPPGPPTDPDVRNARIRFLTQSGCYPRALPWRAVGRVGALAVSPLAPARGCSARRRLPSRGSLGPHCPTFLGTLRRDDRPLSVSGDFAGRAPPRYLACYQSSWSPQRDSGRGGSPRSRQGLWSPGPPSRDCGQGDRWLSHVPAFPLWLHAPLSDPGGGLDPRHNAPRTAAYRPLDSVGFPLPTPLRDILVSTTRRMAGRHHTACILAPPGSVRPLTGRHAGALLSGWLDVSQVGLAPTGQQQPVA